MNRCFVHIYEFLRRHSVFRRVLMIGSFLIMLFFACQVRFEEDITRFFPDTENTRNTEIVFRNLKVKDKIVVMLFASDAVDPVSADYLIKVASSLNDSLKTGEVADYIQTIFGKIDNNLMDKTLSFIYDNLPVFIDENDYGRIDSLLTPEAIDSRMQSNMRYLLLPGGGRLKDAFTRDPLGIGAPVLESLQSFQLTKDYTLYNDHVFSSDMSTLLLFITPRYGTGATGKNDVLIDELETIFQTVQQYYPGVKIEYFGGPSVSVYNARQIKKDTTFTLSIALVIIIFFIAVVFKNRSSILLIILPVVYGSVFSLACISFFKGSVSSIAIGAGAAIFGVALSYSIHVLSHVSYVTSIRQLIEELAYPMTIGSFTTVGAFLGLLFTSSAILRDFGLFSALSLIGTTFFCLVFLPHLLKIRQSHKTSGRVLQWIEKINSYAYERNKPLVATIVILFVACLFFFRGVTFDSDLTNLSFEPKHIKSAEDRLTDLFNSDNKTSLFVSTGQTPGEGLTNYILTNRVLDSLKTAGKIDMYASAEKLLIPFDSQQERIRKWETYWTPERKDRLKTLVETNGRKYGFRGDAFEPFSEVLERTYKPVNFASLGASYGMLEDWVAYADSLSMYITQVRLSDEGKEEVYAALSGNNGLVIFDRGYFANQWISAVNKDFDLVLYICSFLVFFALLVSYGRIELTLMTFAPMAISWVIILGVMAVGGIQFNIVNIILATFIFGLGDDFCIFIMDGLKQEYRTGKRILASHKTAIFFSSFTAVAGLGALIFAKHPALQSISLISILGMTSVILVSYTILPILFRTFISNPAAKGHYPHTFTGLLTTTWFYSVFFIGSSLLIGAASVIILFPISGKKKKQVISRIRMHLLRGLIKSSWVTSCEIQNPAGEDFLCPAVVVANHQSFIDTLIMLSLSPKMLIVTANWVWDMPVLGRIARQGDFVHSGEGYEMLVERLRNRIEDGYSVTVFPEGTRSSDLRIRRFHKGAFYIAEKLKLDIVPVTLYGTGMVISKPEPLRIKSGLMIARILPRIPYGDKITGHTYQEKTKYVTALIRNTYKEIREKEDKPDNPYFPQKLVANYLYKGPVEEWYIRIKIRMERNYEWIHRLVPRKAVVTDIGCGYGMLSYMLHMLSEERHVLGIDYDSDKIALANHNFSRDDRIRFVWGDALSVDYPGSDVFILSDILHYMDYASQERLIGRCMEKLLPGGFLVIRDSNASDRQRHRLTRFTEFLSTRLTGFNKCEQQLCFPHTRQFESIARRYNFTLQQEANDRFTSNTIYILRPR